MPRWGASSPPATPMAGLVDVAKQWGLYLNNQPAIVAESVVSFEIRQDYRIVEYPNESGAFESYDKVWIPYIIHLKLAQGQSDLDRQTFLDSLESLADDTNLYDAVTPEKTYTNVNVQHYDYRRQSDNGVSLIVADLWLEQIIADVSPQFTSVKVPSAANPVSGGTVQTQAATTKQQSAVQASPDLTTPFAVDGVPVPGL